MNLDKSLWATQTWDSWFAMAACATTTTKRILFCDMVWNVAQAGLPCDECTNHFRELMRLYDPKAFASDNKGLVVWLWKIKNEVNHIIGKPDYPLENVLMLYFGGEAKCQRSCMIHPSQSRK
jgi:hypothetical protein